LRNGSAWLCSDFCASALSYHYANRVFFPPIRTQLVCYKGTQMVLYRKSFDERTIKPLLNRISHIYAVYLPKKVSHRPATHFV